MKKQFFYIFMVMGLAFSNAQSYKTAQGDIENIAGIDRYNIVFEYAEDMKIPNYDSEQKFLEFQGSKREKKKVGSGQEFKKLWFENRTNLYEPKFIQEFNRFRLKKRQVTVAKNITAAYTMVVKTLLIYPGYDLPVIYAEDAKLEVTITVYKTQTPKNILYKTKIVRIHGKGSKDEYERVLSAYGELGRATSKHFCRKT